jgi:hypothetical protein
MARTQRKTKQKKATHPVLFRSASRNMAYEDWQQHRIEPNGTDIEMAEFLCREIAKRYVTDPHRMRTFVVQSSVDNGKTWQTQRCIQGDQV